MSDKRREKGAESRKIIIDAAVNCIATRGLCDTTLDKIADIANVSRTLVVFHFKSKKQMLAIVLEEIASQYNAEWESILNKTKNKSPEKRLLELIKYDVKLPVNKPNLIAVWHAFWGEAKGLYKEFNSARDEKYSRDLNHLISQIADNNYQTTDIRGVVTGLEAMLLGFWWTAHVNPRQYNYRNCMRIIKSYLKLNFPKNFN